MTVSDDFETEVQRFSTDSEEQVPNASFEEWGMEGKSQILAADYNSIFWDSGNHGATTIGSQYNLTVPDEEYKHSGTYSAKLSSKKVIIKFAAGNLFAGQYLETLGTNGVLGWGRPFTSRPKAMKVWVRYTPVAITDVGGAPAGVSVSKGDMDTGIIYTALVDDTKTTYGSKAWPSVVNTKTQEFFDKNGANVIAYGEHVFPRQQPATVWLKSLFLSIMPLRIRFLRISFLWHRQAATATTLQVVVARRCGWMTLSLSTNKNLIY